MCWKRFVVHIRGKAELLTARSQAQHLWILGCRRNTKKWAMFQLRQNATMYIPSVSLVRVFSALRILDKLHQCGTNILQTEVSACYRW